MQLTRAQQFIAYNARPLDKRLFDYHFNKGSRQTVLTELAHFQKADGGYGYAIEPDFRMPHSSPMATSVGLQYARAVDAAPDDPHVAAAIAYLAQTFNQDGGYWQPVPEAVNEYPHAPWWHAGSDQPPDSPLLWANPNAELAGYIFWGAEQLESSLVDRVAAVTAQQLAASDLNQYQDRPAALFYALLCWQRVLPLLPQPLQDDAAAFVASAYESQMPLTDEKIAELQIAWLAPEPDSILAQLIPEQVQAALAREATEQQEDGGWWPGWEWGQYEAVWPQARRDWAGKITVELLIVLRNHNLL